MSRRHLVPVVLFFGLAGACSLLTKPEQGPVKCEVSKNPGALDPCPADMVCVNEICTQIACTMGIENCTDHEDNDCDGKIDETSSTPELCNAQDDDCDGKIDEGFDQDGDGITSCGDTSFNVGTYDCDPLNDAVKPGATEVCDGLDNDCDGNTDEARADEHPLCDSSEFCMGRCLKRTCAVPDSGVTCKALEKCVDDKCMSSANCAAPCMAREYCDQKTFTCMPLPQRANGEACSTNDDCVSHLCIDTAALNLPQAMLRGVCGKACCSDAECDSNETCIASGTGARTCLPKTVAMNTPSPCFLDTDCGSQVCAAGELSLSVNAKKVGSAICRMPSSSERNVGESCLDSANCKSRLCTLGSVWGPPLCTTPCRQSSECSTKVEMAAATLLDTPHAYCEFVNLGDYYKLSTLQNSFAPICLVSRDERGTATPGAPCKVTRDCADGACIGASNEGDGRCAPTCCSNDNCKGMGSNVLCLPTARGTGRFEMRCLPKE